MTHRHFLSYARADGEEATRRLRALLEEEGLTAWQDLREIGSEDSVWPQIEAALAAAEHLVVVVTPKALESDYIRREWRRARECGATISAVMAVEMQRRSLPRWLRRAEVYRLDDPARLDRFIATLKSGGRRPRAVWDEGLLLDRTVARAGVVDAVRRALLSDDAEPVAVTSVLHGRGGFGKSTVAAMIAQDPAVRDAYIDGVFWVALGRDTANARLAIEILVERMTGQPSVFPDIGSASEALRRLLDRRDALLIVDDAWRRSDLEPFLKATKNSAILVTSRIADVLPTGATLVAVDQLTQDEARELLSRDLAPATAEALALDDFAREFWFWAQLLAIANTILVARVQFGQSLTQALAELTERLRFGGLVEKDPRGLTLDAGLRLSLDELDLERRGQVEQLAILAEDTPVPIPILARLWDLSLSDTRDRAIAFHRAAFLAKVDLRPEADEVLIHDNVLWFLRRHVGKELPARHAAFLDKVRPSSGLWSDLPSAATYVWSEHRAHLIAAVQTDQAAALLTDYAWIKGKLQALGITRLLADYRRQPTPGAGASLIGRALGMAAPVLSGDPDGLAWQLVGRLNGSSVVDIQRLQGAAAADLPGIRLIRSGLSPPGAEILRIEGHGFWVTSVAFSPDGARVLTGSGDRTARLWDAITGMELACLDGHDKAVTSVAFSPDGGSVLTGSYDGTARLWDAESGAEMVRFIGHDNKVTSVAFSPDGARVLTGSEDGTARLWDGETGAELVRLIGHDHTVSSVTFSPDGARVLTGSADCTARLWNSESGAELRRYEKDIGRSTSVAFSPDGRCVLTSDWSRVHLRDTESGGEQLRFDRQDGPVTSVALSPDGDRVLTGSGDRTARLWDAKSGVELHRFEGHEKGVLSVAISPDGSGRVLTGSEDRTARLWQTESISLLRQADQKEGPAMSVAFSRFGTRIFTGHDSGSMRLWNAATGAELRRFDWDDYLVTSVAISRDGRRILTGSINGSALLRDAKSGAKLRLFEGHEQPVNSVSFSPDGRSVVTGSADGTARLWDMRSGAELKKFDSHEHRVTNIAFSSDGLRILTVSGSAVKLLDARSGVLLRSFDGSITGSGVAFSPDGRRIFISGSHGFPAKVWDAHSGAVVLRLVGQEGEGTCAAFSPDGSRIVTGSDARTVWLWDAQSGREISRMAGDAAILCIAWAGRRIAFGDALGRLTLLEVSP